MHNFARNGLLVTFMVASVLTQPYPGSPKNYPNPPYQPAKAPYQQDYKVAAYGNSAPNYGRVANYTSYNAPSASILLQSGNVITATGETSAVNVEVPDGTEYYVNKQYELIRVDPEGLFQHSQTRIATNVEHAFRGFDDCIWFTDYTQNSDIWRVRYRDTPEKIPGQPNPVNFEKVAPRNCDSGFGVASDGSLWHYTSDKWIRRKEVTNAIDASWGTDGTMMYLGRDYNLNLWDWESRSWVVFQTGVWVFGLYEIDVIVTCDQQYYCKRWSYGKWVNIPDLYCTAVSVNKDSFYCTTPQGQVKLVGYYAPNELTSAEAVKDG